MTKELRVDIPAGLIPNPEAFPRCTDAQLDANACPAASQVGTQELTVRGRLGLTPELAIPQTPTIKVPIYNMVVAPDQVARFSFNPAYAPGAVFLQGDKSPIHIVGGVRDTGDFGMFFTIKTPADPQLISARQVFWAPPALRSGTASARATARPTRVTCRCRCRAPAATSRCRSRTCRS